MKLSIVEKRFKGFFKYRYYGIIASIILFFIVNYEETINKTDFPVGFLIAGILFISLYSLGYLFRSLSQTYRVIGEAKFNNDSIELNFLEIKKTIINDLKEVEIDLNFIEGTKYYYTKGRSSKYQFDASRKFNEGIFNYITIQSNEINIEFEFYIPSKEVYQNILNFKNENLNYKLIFKYFGKKINNPEKEI